MSPEYISLSAGMCAKEALEKIRKTGTDFYTLYITNGKHRLTGTVALYELLTYESQSLQTGIRPTLPIQKAGNKPPNCSRNTDCSLCRSQMSGVFRSV